LTPARRVELLLEVGRLAAQLDRIGNARGGPEERTASLLSHRLDAIVDELAAIDAPATRRPPQ
jgi:hypothetical protein